MTMGSGDKGGSLGHAVIRWLMWWSIVLDSAGFSGRGKAFPPALIASLRFPLACFSILR